MLSVEEPVLLDGTHATCRCHFIAFDGNRKPMVDELALIHQ